ncbi:MAG: phosphatidylglycerophosphatase A [Candidatus Accumulibacter sp.]|uniref:phosphatidylglycerophosphatase A family protein n=1 Tax=Accumulibacter sp. TaxID=2053492 RepID=UPI00258CF332|nr:phosphatidylglycerophosphatase A [Accumulibacter sp.]MBK8114864.1 phosphatidylglycerophosphatase A [Accumulibacter sp.]
MRTDKRRRSTKEDSITLASPPTIRFLLAHPAHLVACGFGSGLSPRAPGTVGTLFAWASFPLLRPWMSDLEFLGLLFLCFVGGVLAVHKTGADLGVVDHGSIVWDEIVPFWAVLLFCPTPGLWQAIAFGLFRFFDIVKPQPARYFDEKVKNGFGVMCDDLVAAGYTLLVLAILRFVLE